MVLGGNEAGRAFYAACGLRPDGRRDIDERTQLPEILLRVPVGAAKGRNVPPGEAGR